MLACGSDACRRGRHRARALPLRHLRRRDAAGDRGRRPDPRRARRLEPRRDRAGGQPTATQALALVAGSGYAAERIIVVEGRVEETIAERAPDTVALLRLDTDWYESTKRRARAALSPAEPREGYSSSTTTGTGREPPRGGRVFRGPRGAALPPPGRLHGAAGREALCVKQHAGQKLEAFIEKGTALPARRQEARVAERVQGGPGGDARPPGACSRRP